MSPCKKGKWCWEMKIICGSRCIILLIETGWHVFPAVITRDYNQRGRARRPRGMTCFPRSNYKRMQPTREGTQTSIGMTCFPAKLQKTTTNEGEHAWIHASPQQLQGTTTNEGGHADLQGWQVFPAVITRDYNQRGRARRPPGMTCFPPVITRDYNQRGRASRPPRLTCFPRKVTRDYNQRGRARRNTCFTAVLTRDYNQRGRELRPSREWRFHPRGCE